jgi:hypothetical protein
LVAVTGCAGTHVRRLAQVAPDSAHARPPRIVAVLFENDSALPPWEQDTVKRKYVAAVVAALGQALGKQLTARQLIVVDTGGPADLLLVGRVEEIQPGKKALRILVGLGAGKATMRVNVSLVDLRPPERATLLTFGTESTTGSLPGAAIGPAATGVEIAGKGLGVAGGVRAGLAQEAAQTAKKIDGQLQTYFGARGWPYPKPEDAN